VGVGDAGRVARGDAWNVEAARGCAGEGGAEGVEAAHGSAGAGGASRATRGGEADEPAGKGGTIVGDTGSWSRSTSRSVRGSGGGGKREVRLVENNVTRDEDSVGGEVKTPIPVMIGRVAEEDTTSGARGELMRSSRSEIGIASAPEDTKMVVGVNRGTLTLIKRMTL
jgi:hypothetical protein